MIESEFEPRQPGSRVSHAGHTSDLLYIKEFCSFGIRLLNLNLYLYWVYHILKSNSCWNELYFYPQVDLITGLAIEEACYAQVCNTTTNSMQIPLTFCISQLNYISLNHDIDTLLQNHTDGLKLFVSAVWLLPALTTDSVPHTNDSCLCNLENA